MFLSDSLISMTWTKMMAADLMYSIGCEWWMVWHRFDGRPVRCSIGDKSIWAISRAHHRSAR